MSLMPGAKREHALKVSREPGRGSAARGASW